MGSNAYTFRDGYRGSVAERMATKTRRTTPDDCWMWTGSKDTAGYGHIRIDGRLRRATHVVLGLTGAPLPRESEVVMHSCDHPACVNPSHLSLGTKKSNAADMKAKGRKEWPKHEAHPMAKLTTNQVAEIRSIYGQGKPTFTALAERFGVNRCTVSRIVKNQGWR